MAEHKQSVRFHWTTSNQFRVIHADGAYGGLTPYGAIFVALYSDHPPIPDVTVQPVSEEGLLGPEIAEGKVAAEGIEREVEVSIVMSIPTAEALRDWLNERIKLAEKAQQEIQQHRMKEQQESEVKTQ